jgi:hypothetical protein
MMINFPLFFFWIAEFSDDTALSQFDLDSGEENRADPDWLPTREENPSPENSAKIVKFGWSSFNFNLAVIIKSATGINAIPSQYSAHTINILPEEKLIAYRRTMAKQFKYHVCRICDHKWQFGELKEDPLMGLPVSNEAFIEHIPINTQQGPKTITYVSAICPKCKYHDTNAVMIPDKKIKRLTDEIHRTEYILGKHGGPLTILHEDGSVSYEQANQKK